MRDDRNGAIGDYPIEERELRARRYAQIDVVATLALVDLRGDGPVRMGIPSDVARASSQSLGRAWSLALYEHPAKPDGIIYPPRLNDETNLAIFDLSVAKLRVASNVVLIAAPGLAGVLDDFKVALA